MGLFKNIFGPWSAISAFNRLSDEERRVVFYAEGKSDWPHLGPIVEQLTGSLGRTVCYLTSDETDPVFLAGNPRVHAFNVGSASARTVLFKSLKAGVLVMTLPDLDNLQLKRSAYPVHYVYVFHSIVSSHMIYRKGAFDAFDTVFCVGPHHRDEIRQTEKVYGLRQKALVEHGYGRLDRILQTASERPAFSPTPGRAKKILLAPSWGECSFIEAPIGWALAQLLVDAGHTVTLRLHPMTVRRFPKLADSAAQRFKASPSFRVETDMHALESLHQSDLMISDWSGAAFEYAFGLERPVLFVDTPKKVNNPEYEKLGLPALEASVREDLGGVIDPLNLGEVAGIVDSLCADPAAFRLRLREARERWVYNVGRSAGIAASHITRLADGLERNLQHAEAAK